MAAIDVQQPNGWHEYSKLVLGELERLSSEMKDTRNDEAKAIREIQKEITDIRVALSQLKTEVNIKSGIVGALGGIVASSIIGFIFALFRGNK